MSTFVEVFCMFSLVLGGLAAGWAYGSTWQWKQLMPELTALRNDAARLTWLDESKEVDSVGPTLCCGKHRATLREAIDAAMAMEAACKSTT